MVGETQWANAAGQSWRDHEKGLEATFAPINPLLAETLEAADDMWIADIGCGSGGLTRYLAKEAVPDGKAVGFDISEALIDTARAASGGSNIKYVCANAQTHTLISSQFDRLTSRFGVMFFEDDVAAFRNLNAWLKPGGKFSFAVWGHYFDNPWQGVIRDVVSQYLDMPSLDHNNPGPIRYADSDHLVELLKAASFSMISSTSWSGLLKLGGGLNADAAAEFGLSAFWSQELPVGSQEYEKARIHLRNMMLDHEVEGQVSMAAKVHLVSGERGI